MPIGLCLVIDEANGGDVTAQELVKRFDLLHWSSGNIMDFYYFGWQRTYTPGEPLSFDLRAFHECHKSLQKAGIIDFGGNADLILVDVHYRWSLCDNRIDVTKDSISLDFSQAIHINLSSGVKSGDIPSVGEFLQSVIRAAEQVRTSLREGGGAVFAMSDSLGLATAKQSVLSFILEKCGAIIGAKKLAALTTRDLGPMINVDDIVIPTSAFRPKWA